MTSDTGNTTLTLSAEETEVLRSALTDLLAELHDEIVKTDDHQYRQLLRQREMLLSGMLTRLPE